MVVTQGQTPEAELHALTVPLHLHALEKVEAARLLQLALGIPDLPELLVDEVSASCRGNPGLLHEMALFLADSGCIEITPAGVVFHKSRIPGKTLPGSVEHYVRAAWDRFGDEERSLLAILSLLFQPQPLPILASLARIDVWRVDEIVSALAERGILSFVRISDRELPSVESEALRRIFVSSLSPQELAGLHKTIAVELLDAGGNGAPCQPETLAWHWFHAGERMKASALAVEGASRLLAAGSFRQAVELADIASETGASMIETNRLLFEIHRLWGKYEDGVARLSERLKKSKGAEEKQQVTLYLSELYFRMGSYDRALEGLTDLAENAKGAIAAQATALLARVCFYGGKHAQARSTGENGMLVLPPDTREYALCAAIVGLVRVYEGKLQQGAKYLETALSILEKCGSPSDIAFAANAVGLASHRLKDWANAVSHYSRSLEVASAAGDAERIMVACANLAVVHQENGEFAAAISRYENALGMAWQSRNLPAVSRIFNNLGNIHRYLGMLQKARDFAERSIELADKLGLGLSQGLNRMLLGEILILQARPVEAIAMLQQAREHFQQLKSADETLECDIDLIELALSCEEWDKAVQLAQVAAQSARSLKLDNHRLRSLICLGAALLKREGPEDLGAAASALEEASELADVGNAELEFKLWGLRTQAYTLLGEADKASTAQRRADNALAGLRNRIPQDLHSVFFNRPDRKRAMGEYASFASRMAQLAQTMSPAAPVPAAIGQPQRWVAELIRMNQRLLAQHDIEKLLETLIDVVVDLSGAERGFVILGGQSGLDVVVARNMDREAIRKSRSKFSTTIARKVLAEGRMIRLTDAAEADDFRSKKSIMALQLRSVICLPMASPQGTIGAIYLDNRFKPGVFSESVVEMLTAFAEQAAIAIENARLLQKYRTSLEQLETSRKEVERLNSRLEETVAFQKSVIEQKTEELSQRQEQLEERYQFANIVGRSRAIETLFSAMSKVKETSVPVLVTGESGSGKELVARALHFSGPRRKQRFVSINCAALPDSLLESELFGYVEGAFTDARKEKKGLFAIADEGTLFMDEVGDMSLTMQSKLLRVLQEGEFSPLGSEETCHADVRIVTATNKDLKALVAAGQFRQDLYYRLDVVSIRVPALRERKDDIPLLVEHFLLQYGEKNRVVPPKMSLHAMQILMAYDWPGNVRELQSVVTTAAVFADSGTISVESLGTKPEVFGPGRRPDDLLGSLDTLDLREIERRAVISALRKADGNKMKAARLLGISRRALYNKLEAFGIRKSPPES